jgi:choline kinase
MNGLVVAAGRCTRMQDHCEKQSKVLLDLGGETLLGNLLNQFGRAGVEHPIVVVGFDAFNVVTRYGDRATCLLNPFYETSGILGSIWEARHHLAHGPFLFSTGDHYFPWSRLERLLADQPDADVLVDVEIKTCDEEDMKVYVAPTGELRAMTKAFLKGTILGEFTGLVRFSAEGSRLFFEQLERYAWKHGVKGYLADVLVALHKKSPLAFHLCNHHDRIEVDFPLDLARAQQLYRKHRTLAA